MSLIRRATKTAAVLRSVITTGKRQNPSAHLSGLKCTQLYPADVSRLGQLVQLGGGEGGLESLVNIFETIMIGNHDIRPGDILVVDTVRYVIRGAAQWDYPIGANYFMQLTVEKILQ
jgi:hypothetical protein